MTGYGRGEVRENGFEILVEARSLNNRFLDISVRLPKEYSQLEQDVKDFVRQYISRGRINLVINLKNANGYKAPIHQIDTELLKGYLAVLRDLVAQTEIVREIKLSDILSLPNIWIPATEDEPRAEVWRLMQQAIELSLRDLRQMRKKEGDQLAQDLKQRIRSLETAITFIESQARTRIVSEFNKLNERLKLLMPSENIEPGRLEQEVALLADRVDVTEECIRFRSHNQIFVDAIDAEDAAGRRLNFVLQEMNREANTIGAKANDAEIARQVIQIKEELEKIREQVQNIE